MNKRIPGSSLPAIPAKLPGFLDDNEIASVLQLSGKRWQETEAPCRRFQSHRDYALVSVLFQTGIRIGEACRLLWSEVDSLNHTVQIKTLKKRKLAFRSIPVLPELSSILLNLRLDGQTHVRAFHDSKNKTIWCRIDRPFSLHSYRARARLRKLMLDAGVPSLKAHPHIWRHSFAVRAVRSGMHPMMLTRLLGHSSPTVTMIYYHLLGQDARPFLEEMAAIRKV